VYPITSISKQGSVRECCRVDKAFGTFDLQPVQIEAVRDIRYVTLRNPILAICLLSSSASSAYFSRLGLGPAAQAFSRAALARRLAMHLRRHALLTLYALLGKCANSVDDPSLDSQAELKAIDEQPNDGIVHLDGRESKWSFSLTV